MAKKTDKTHKLRGSREHGRGMKKGRGAGLRGGKGQAGWKHKKLHFLLYDQDRIRGARNHGFTRHAQDTEPALAVTVQDVDERAEAWAAEGKAARADSGFTLDLGAMGFDKLLGTGQVKRRLVVTVPRASPGAVTKIQAAGGSVNQTDPAPPPAPKGKPAGGPGGAGGSPPGGKGAKAPPEGKAQGKAQGKAPGGAGGAKPKDKGAAPPAAKPPKQNA